MKINVNNVEVENGVVRVCDINKCVVIEGAQFSVTNQKGMDVLNIHVVDTEVIRAMQEAQAKGVDNAPK